MISTSITAILYVGLFAATNAVLATKRPAVKSGWLSWASTDLVNLGTHPVQSMIASAFVDDSDILAWIALGLIALISAGHTLGNVGCAVVVTVAHVVGTLVSEGILALRIDAARAPASEHVSLDIGPSFVVVAALGAAIVYGRWPERIASGIAFALLAPHLFGGLGHLDVGPVGHCCSIVIGVALGFPFHRSWRSPSAEVPTAP